MRSTLIVPGLSDPDSGGLFVLAQQWLPFALWLLMPFIVGLLVGVAFTYIIRRQGWRAKVISTWPIAVMFGTLAYVVTPGIVFVALTGLWPRIIIMGLVLSLYLTWPIWLVMGPVFYIYIGYLKRREKWLRDSTVVYLSAFSLTSECVFAFWMSP
jgi:hypothetical protein